jgi:hypothetical protein
MGSALRCSVFSLLSVSAYAVAVPEVTILVKEALEKSTVTSVMPAMSLLRSLMFL